MGTNNHGFQNAAARSGKREQSKKNYSGSYDENNVNRNNRKPAVENYSQPQQNVRRAAYGNYGEGNSNAGQRRHYGFGGRYNHNNAGLRDNNPVYSEKGAARQEAAGESRRAFNAGYNQGRH
jgi:hypothetical protein